MAESIANWPLLVSDERFRHFPAGAYHDDQFIRDHARLGFQEFASNGIDHTLLLLLAKADVDRCPLVIGAPFTPCHWGSLSVLFHLIRRNERLRDQRRVFWLTTERRERGLLARLRMQSKFRRVVDAVTIRRGEDDLGCEPSGTELVLLKSADELQLVQPQDRLIVSDPRGELTVRKGEAEELVRRIVSLTQRSTVIIPSRHIVRSMESSAMCFPFSDGAIAAFHVPQPASDFGIPWEWARAARNAGRTERNVIRIDGIDDVETRLADLKNAAYKVFSRPKNFYDVRLTMEFQRIISSLRQLAIPVEYHENSDEPGTFKARISLLESRLDGASLDIFEYLQISLMLLKELFQKLSGTEAKWEPLRRCVDESIERGVEFTLALPQADSYSAWRTQLFISEYAASKGIHLVPETISNPLDLLDRKGDVVLLGVPKLAHASRWRIPFDGRLTMLTWGFEHVLGILALKGANDAAESMRRRTWRSKFVTNPDAYVPQVADESVTSESEIVNMVDDELEIEAFDLTYRGRTQTSSSRLADAVRERSQYELMMDDGSVVHALAAETQHVVVVLYGGSTSKPCNTTDLKIGDRIVLINGETYDQLTARLRIAVDRVTGLLSFAELWERWQLICIEKDESRDIREVFVQKVVGLGCKRTIQTIQSWLSLKRYGPEHLEDIVYVALAAEDYELAKSAEDLHRGLEEKRARHRSLGKWLHKALAASVTVDEQAKEKVIDANLGITFGELQRAMSVKKIIKIHAPKEEVNAEQP
jgi:hypothetical protein